MRCNMENQREEHNYDDIINLPHYVSKKRPPMPISERAAQFSPFSALTGYEEAVKETARLTKQDIELDESQKRELNEKLNLVLEKIEECPEIKITYFAKDEKKTGGTYIQTTGHVSKIDLYEKLVWMEDRKIAIADIRQIDAEWFDL